MKFSSKYILMLSILIVPILILSPIKAYSQSDTNSARVIFNKGIALHKKGKEDSASLMINRSMKIFTSLHDTLSMSDCYSALGLILQNKGEFSSAMDEYMAAFNLLQASPRLRFSLSMLTLTTRTGSLYFDQGDYLPATKEFQKAMILAKKIHSKAGLILCSLNLGAISEVYEDFRGAEGYYHVSLQNAAEISDYLNMAISLFNLGSVYYKQDLLPKAYRCFTRSLHLSDSIGDREGTAACLSYLGMVYETSGKTAEALYQYTQALKIFEELGQQKNIAGTLTMIGKNMLYNGDKPKAKEYFTKSLEIASEIGAKPEMADNFEYLAMVCSYEGNFALAEKYFGQYSEINLKSRTAPLSMEPKAQRPATQELSDSAKKAQYRLLKIAFMIFATILLFMLFFLASKRVAGTYKQKT